MARCVDLERQIPVAEHGEGVADVVLAATERPRLAVALHLRHGTHRRHVVDEADACAVDRLAVRVIHGHVQHVFACARRIGIDGDLDEQVSRVQCVACGRLRLRARRSQQNERDRPASDALHVPPPRLARVPGHCRQHAAAPRAAARSWRDASPDSSRACASRVRLRVPS